MRNYRLLFLLFLLIFIISCGGGGKKKPIIPIHEGVSVPISVSGAKASPESVTVTNRGCPELDLQRVHNELETAWRRATREDPQIIEKGWLGFRIIFDPRIVGDDYKAYYDFVSSSAFIACGAYGAVEHEPGHHWCHKLSKNCCEKTWHPWWDRGVDLNCKRKIR